MKHNLDLIKNNSSEEELEKYIHLFESIDWIYISAYQKLSEEFIENHSDDVRWELISKYQILSENFIEKYSDKLMWDNVSLCQNLSEFFIKKHINKIDIDCLMINKKISKRLKNKIEKEINLLKEII